jgi:hypothetical protein
MRVCKDGVKPDDLAAALSADIAVVDAALLAVSAASPCLQCLEHVYSKYAY